MKVARRRKVERNTFGLPTGEPIRRVLAAEFRRQRVAVLALLGLGRKDQMDPLGPTDWGDLFDPGPLGDRITPLISAIWDREGSRFLSRIGLDPASWEVVDPNTAAMIETAALALADSTMATTREGVETAIEKTRQELLAGVVDRGESVRRLTDRIKSVFTDAETWRARRIAATEAARAVHAAQEQTAVQSGVVTGWRWLLSADACPLCHRIAEEVGAVRLGQRFATVGDHPVYAEVRHPPAHPGCQCSLVPILDIDEQPAEWGVPLDRPELEPAA